MEKACLELIMEDKGETKYDSLVSLEHLVDTTFAKMGVI